MSYYTFLIVFSLISFESFLTKDIFSYVLQGRKENIIFCWLSIFFIFVLVKVRPLILTCTLVKVIVHWTSLWPLLFFFFFFFRSYKHRPSPDKKLCSDTHRVTVNGKRFGGLTKRRISSIMINHILVIKGTSLVKHKYQVERNTHLYKKLPSVLQRVNRESLRFKGTKSP